MKPLFLRLLLIDSLFGSALAAGAIVYRDIHPVAIVAIAVVLLAFSSGAAACLFLAWNERGGRLLNDVGELAELLPGLALLGTAAGFMIALSGDSANIQHRISGAATGIASTFIGVACWIVLSAQHRMLSRHAEEA